MAEELLVRMFYANGNIETRPLEWVRLTTPDDIVDCHGVDMAKIIKPEIEKNGEVFICFINQLTGMQIYSGTYIDARKRAHV